MQKKDFSTSERMNKPVDMFLPHAETDTPQADPQTEPPVEIEHRAGSKYVAAVDPYNEPRNRRVQLIMRPSMYAGLKYLAARRKSSVNNLVESIVAEYIERMRTEAENAKKDK